MTGTLVATGRDIAELRDREHGKHGMIVGGGPSGAIQMCEAPLFLPGDNAFIIAINGAIQRIPNAKYWLCVERVADGLIAKWKVHADAAGATCVMNRKAVDYYPDAYLTKRSSLEPDPREIRKGLRIGGRHKQAGGRLSQITGTSALCALHLAAYLGCETISSVGIDLCFKDGKNHWYPNPATEVCLSQANPSGTTAIEYKGYQSLDWWYCSAKELLRYRAVLAEHGCEWTDYSDGLIQRVEVANDY